MSAQPIKIAAKISLLYALVAGLWILFSDRVAEAFFPRIQELTHFQTSKELSFIAVTALLLYVLVRDQLRKHEAQAAKSQQAEGEFRESESRFRQLAESLPQLVWTCTPDGECDFLSRQWVEFTGIPAPGQLGRRWLQQIHPDDRARIAEAWQANVGSGSSFQTEYRLRHRDGSYRWFDARAVPLRNAAGGVVKWFGSSTDIHTQRELRESLAREIAAADVRAAQLADISRAARASEEKLRTIFEAEPECLKLLEPDGTLREMNPAGLQMLEVESLASVLGQCLIPWVVPEHRANVLAALEATERGEQRTLELQILGFKGTLRWLEMSTVPFRDPATGKNLILGVSRDVTERRRVEQLVARSEMRLQLVWEHAILAMRLADAEGNIVRVNPAYCQTVGKSRAELEGHPFAIAYAEKDRPQAMDDYRRRFQNHAECRQRPADVTYWNGKRAQLEVSDVFLEVAGQSTLLLTIINDVTLRHQAERRVTVFAEMTRALSAATSRRAASEIIAEAAQKLLGWDACFFYRYDMEKEQIENVLSRETLDGKIVDVSMPAEFPATSPCVLEVLRHGTTLILRSSPQSEARVEKAEGGTPPSSDFRTLTSAFIPVPFGDTQRRSESLMYVPVREGRRTIGILSIQSYTPHAYDQASLATLKSLAEQGAGALERIRAEEFLQTREQQFRSLIENTSDMIAVINRDGLLGFQSPSVERVLGYRPEELAGRNVMELIHPDDLPAARAGLARALSAPHTPIPFEGRLRHRDGSWRRIQTVGRGGPEESGKAAIILSARDVTESRALEEQFRQSQRMEAIGQLAGGVAHDFNNLLAVIQMQVELLKLEPARTPEQVDSANEIGQAAQRAADLTRQLLMFSRRQPPTLNDVDLNEIVGHVTKMLGRLLGEDVHMQVNCAPQPLFIHADTVMVDQILLNLAVNSRDAMPQGGRLIIETSQVEFDPAAALSATGSAPETTQSLPTRPGVFACLSVSDTGKGIPPEILPHIFEPFFTTKDVGKGTGLGLATVFGIVQQHQGWINVSSDVGLASEKVSRLASNVSCPESRSETPDSRPETLSPGRGTTFRIYLPLHNQSRIEPASEPAPGAAQGGHETILLVEDEPALRTLVCTILTRLGYRVLEAPTGVAALEVWKNHRHEINLLLTDLVMPDGISGKELAQRLLAEDSTLKVIYTSGYSQDVAGDDFPLREGENFLAKPFQAAKLAQTIRARLDA